MKYYNTTFEILSPYLFISLLIGALYIGLFLLFILNIINLSIYIMLTLYNTTTLRFLATSSKKHKNKVESKPSKVKSELKIDFTSILLKLIRGTVVGLGDGIITIRGLIDLKLGEVVWVKNNSFFSLLGSFCNKTVIIPKKVKNDKYN